MPGMRQCLTKGGDVNSDNSDNKSAAKTRWICKNENIKKDSDKIRQNHARPWFCVSLFQHIWAFCLRKGEGCQEACGMSHIKLRFSASFANPNPISTTAYHCLIIGNAPQDLRLQCFVPSFERIWPGREQKVQKCQSQRRPRRALRVPCRSIWRRFFRRVLIAIHDTMKTMK